MTYANCASLFVFYDAINVKRPVSYVLSLLVKRRFMIFGIFSFIITKTQEMLPKNLACISNSKIIILELFFTASNVVIAVFRMTYIVFVVVQKCWNWIYLAVNDVEEVLEMIWRNIKLKKHDFFLLRFCCKLV